MKKSSLRAQNEKRTLWHPDQPFEENETPRTHFVRVVEVQDPTPARIHLLMALPLPRHGQRRVHVHVMARQIQADQSLEQNRPSRPGRAQEHQQARRRTSIRHHVEHAAELRRLLEPASRVPVEGVEQAGDGVEQRARARVERHVVEGGDGEDDARVSWSQVSPAMVHDCSAQTYR